MQMSRLPARKMAASTEVSTFGRWLMEVSCPVEQTSPSLCPSQVPLFFLGCGPLNTGFTGADCCPINNLMLQGGD